MTAPHADVVAFTKAYVNGMVARDERVNCTEPEIYYRLTRDIADAMARERHTSVSSHDVETAIKSTPELRLHPLLRRDAYFAAHPAPPTFEQQRHSSMGGGILDFFAQAFGGSSSSDSLLASYEEGYGSSGGNASDRERFIDAEASRVREQARLAVRESLETGSFERYSNDVDGDYYLCLPVKYYAVAAKAVERELELEFSRAAAAAQHQRPFLESFMKYNLTRASGSAKTMFCTMLFFRFPHKPVVVASPTTSTESSSSSSSSSSMS